MNNLTLYEEYRLVEQSGANVNRAWKGAHLLLFFLAFVFGSFCTFCFHMLMYLFDEKCVLFPKLLSLTSMRHNVIYEFMPSNNDLSDLPVDFVSTQWMEKSTCALPTYVPLVSGIFGLVWTTMFLMCSTGTRTFTGLERPWRVLPLVFIFSLAMSILCIYSSVMTHSGLQELCVKLGEITGTSTCTYAVNVVTLVYERRIRGVYQATRLTIVSAWLHTACWLCSALLALLRVVLAVDFQLVRVKVSLRADLDKLMEQHEMHLRTVSPDDLRMKDDYATTGESFEKLGDDMTVTLKKHSDSVSSGDNDISELSLVPREQNKLDRIRAYQNIPRDKRFIPKILYDLLDKIFSPDVPLTYLDPFIMWDEDNHEYANTHKRSALKTREHHNIITAMEETEAIVKRIIDDLIEGLYDLLLELKIPTTTRRFILRIEDSFITQPDDININIQGQTTKTVVSKDKEVEDKNEEEAIVEAKKKSNIKHASSQTEDEKKKGPQKRVLISEKGLYITEDETMEPNRQEPTSKQDQRLSASSEKATQTVVSEKGLSIDEDETNETETWETINQPREQSSETEIETATQFIISEKSLSVDEIETKGTEHQQPTNQSGEQLNKTEAKKKTHFLIYERSLSIDEDGTKETEKQVSINQPGEQSSKPEAEKETQFLTSEKGLPKDEDETKETERQEPVNQPGEQSSSTEAEEESQVQANKQVYREKQD